MIKNFFKVKKAIVFLLIAFALANSRLTAQVSVAGPLCIVPGITYQYIITGTRNASSIMNLCVTGGSLTTGQKCTDAIVSSVFIVWSDTSYHKLEVTSSAGNISLTIHGTTDIRGGLVNISDKVQIYNSAIGSYTFRCDSAVGGSCNPSYLYQWQRSENGLTWTNIEGATSKDLQYTGSVTVTIYFRRVTIESQSNTIGYSDWGQLKVESM